MRRANREDGERIATVYPASFRAPYGFPLAHSDEEVRARVVEGSSGRVVAR